MKRLKDSAFVDFCKEIDLAGSEGLEGLQVHNIKPYKILSVYPLVTVRLCRLLVDGAIRVSPLAIVPSCGRVSSWYRC